MGSDEQRSAQPAKPGETPVDTEHSTSSPESSAPASSNGEVSPESAEKDKPDAESESTAQKESDHDETDSKPRTWSDDFGEGMLALERRRDAEANIDTRPPVGEAVSFRSVTVAEIYAGQAIDSLTSALAAIEWTNFDEPLLDQIAEARRGFQYSKVGFLAHLGHISQRARWLRSNEPSVRYRPHLQRLLRARAIDRGSRPYVRASRRRG